MSPEITALSLTNVRCFSGKQRVKLRRVTLLVGENSAGKSTVLGCLNALARLANLKDLRDDLNPFDEKPFRMGLFDNVARSGEPEFRIGMELDGDHFRRFGLEFTRGDGGGCREEALEAVTQRGQGEPRELRISRRPAAEAGGREGWLFQGKGFDFPVAQSEVSYTQFTTWLSLSARVGALPYGGDTIQYRKRRGGGTTESEQAAFSKFVNFFRHPFRLPETDVRLLPITPRGIRRRRSYTHDPLDVSDGSRRDSLNQRGRDMDLFDRVEVIESAPGRYEAVVDVAGVSRNLMDVGYGVASVLPLLIEWVEAKPTTHFLLQQPEVHVHPSAQAKMVGMMAESPHRFVIETHSDHIIDWFRILVSEGRMAASDLGIAYLERQSDDPTATKIHDIAVDDLGNLTGQPPGYRRFFSEETARLLGFRP